MDDFKQAKARFCSNKVLLYSIDKIYLLERLGDNNPVPSFGQILLVDLKVQLKNSNNLEVDIFRICRRYLEVYRY